MILFHYSLKYRKEVIHSVEQKVNFTINNPQYKEDIRQLLIKNVQISETRPFTAIIQTTLRTRTEDTIWTKQYPLSIADNDYVNEKIRKLLKNSINKPV